MLSVFAESTVDAVVAAVVSSFELLPQPAKTAVAARHRQRSAQIKADTHKDDLKTPEKQPIGSPKQDTVQSK